MNKKLITLAVAAAMVAPLAVAAETTLYGRVDHAVVYADDDVSDSAWDIATNTTRIGVKGSEDLGNGLKGIFAAEWGFDGTEGGSTSSGSQTEVDIKGGTDTTDVGNGNLVNRVAYVGLSGGFGTVTIGRQWTPYNGAVNATDTWNSIDTLGRGASVRGNKYVTRMGNALIYASPNFSGFTASVALQIDGETGGDESDGIDAYNPAIVYSNGPIKIGASLFEYDEDVGQQDFWGVGGSYNFGMFRLLAQYEDIDDSDKPSGADDGYDEWSIGGEVDFGNNTVRALYGQTDWDNNDSDMDFYGLGFQHNFSKRTRIYAEYAVGDRDNKGSADRDQDEFSLGLRHDF